MSRTIHEQVAKYLTDVHSIETQALAQMRRAPGIAGDEQLAALFRRHEQETQDHERRVRGRLEALDARPSLLKDLLGQVTGTAFVLFARSQPDTPGKLVAHAFSYEHLELAAYELLVRIGERAGDAPTVEIARRIRADEVTMAGRLAQSFDAAVDTSLRDLAPADMGAQLDKYLADAHAIEGQAIELLKKAERIGGDPALRSVYSAHLDESREHQRLVAARLAARGARPAAVKDAALRLGALNWGLFFQSQPDTPAKLAGFAYAFEHLEIASYELLQRVARRAHDEETAALAQRILAQERAAAETIAAHFDDAVEASLRDLGVAAPSR